MEKVITHRAFSLQEAVVLLDEYISGVKMGLPLFTIAENASARLRFLAEKNGERIDGGFRSPMGVQNRIRSISAIYHGKDIKSAPSTKVFIEAVTLYRENYSKYEEILQSTLEDNGEVLQNESVIEKQGEAGQFQKTRFVRTIEDQLLKTRFGSDFKATYYGLKKIEKIN